MAKFMFVYRSSKSQHESDLAPEEMQKVMEHWNAWIGQGMEQGWMVSPGDALQLAGKVVKHGNVVSDGPFVEAKELVGGYSIVEADSLDAACEFALSCPAVMDETGSIEIRELAGMA